jgi:hypothetical protein
MGAIREILLTNDSSAPTFTVPTPPGTAPVQISSNGFPSVFFPPSTVGNNYFRAGDSFTIRGYGLYLPENFALCDASLADNTFSVPTMVPSILVYGVSHPIYPFYQYNFTILRHNVYHDSSFFLEYSLIQSYSINAVFQLQCVIDPQIYISMLNVPDSLAGNIYCARCFIEVEHNFPLLAAPP